MIATILFCSSFLEDYEKKEAQDLIRKAYMENYGAWLTYGGFYPDVGLKLVLVTSAAIPLIALMFPTIFSSGEFVLRCENAHFAVFICIELIAAYTVLFQNKIVDEIYLEMAKGFHDYEDTLDEQCRTFISDIILSAKWRKKMTQTVFVGCVMLTCVSATIIRPAVTFYLGIPETNDGVLRLLPVPIWTPFSQTGSWYITLIFFVLEIIFAYISPGIVFGCTLFFVCACEDFGAQLTIVGMTLKSVSERAKCLNMPRDEAIKLCFKHSIEHHETLVRSAKNLENIFYIPGFGLLLGSTILMCMSGFIFLSTEVSLISKTVFCLFLVSELAIIFIFCWYGEYVQQTSTQVCDMVYSSEWVDDMKAMKYYVLIIQARTIRPIKINFGGFMYVSLETYSNICSSAFSYFNLLLAVNNN